MPATRGEKIGVLRMPEMRIGDSVRTGEKETGADKTETCGKKEKLENDTKREKE